MPKNKFKNNLYKSIDSWCYKRDNEIKLNEIIIEKHTRRPLRKSRIEELASSIKERGLMNPIIITKTNKLIAGFHRVEAFKLLGKTSIPCTIVEEEDPIKLKLIEIDENNNRSELVYLDWCEDLLVLKKIYEEKYPETKQGGDRKSEKIKRKNFPLDSFNELMSEKLNKNPRTLRSDVQVAKEVIQSLKHEIRETRLENRKSDLRTISKKDPKEQEEILDVIKELKKEKVKIKDLKQILSKIRSKQVKMKEENLELKGKIHEILEKADRLLEEKKQMIEWLEDLVRKYDAIAYNYVLIDGRINFDKYREFWDAPEWKIGVQIRYRLDSLKDKTLPPFERSRFHHIGRRDWHKVFTEGHFTLDVNHKKGDFYDIESTKTEETRE